MHRLLVLCQMRRLLEASVANIAWILSLVFMHVQYVPHKPIAKWKALAAEMADLRFLLFMHTLDMFVQITFFLEWSAAFGASKLDCGDWWGCRRRTWCHRIWRSVARTWTWPPRTRTRQRLRAGAGSRTGGSGSGCLVGSSLSARRGVGWVENIINRSLLRFTHTAQRRGYSAEAAVRLSDSMNILIKWLRCACRQRLTFNRRKKMSCPLFFKWHGGKR